MQVYERGMLIQITNQFIAKPISNQFNKSCVNRVLQYLLYVVLPGFRHLILVVAVWHICIDCSSPCDQHSPVVLHFQPSPGAGDANINL